VCCVHGPTTPRAFKLCFYYGRTEMIFYTKGDDRYWALKSISWMSREWLGTLKGARSDITRTHSGDSRVTSNWSSFIANSGSFRMLSSVDWCTVNFRGILVFPFSDSNSPNRGTEELRVLPALYQTTRRNISTNMKFFYQHLTNDFVFYLGVQ
jgi:hypothetical protein